MSWRVALIDSCGRYPKALASAAFVSEGTLVRRRESEQDFTGHGTRIAEILSSGAAPIDLLLAQVFIGRSPASAAAVAAAVDWAVTYPVHLVHLSLGLTADRPVLSAAIARALAAGVVVIAASPARGEVVFPASYPGVIAATGDARCAIGELSHLGPCLFGGCPRTAGETTSAGLTSGGASIGAAWVSRAVLTLPEPGGAKSCLEFLATRARYQGPERRMPAMVTVRPQVHTPPS